MYIGATLGLAALVAGVIVVTNNSFALKIGAKGTTLYKHYNAIAATDDEHGCKEFWVSCSDYSFTLTEPTDGTIVEGGNITDNKSFDWDGMTPLDDRFIPSNNKAKAWGMKPVLYSDDNVITYGLMPQTHVTSTDLMIALNELDSSYIDKTTGYYYYEGNFYQTCIGDRCDGDSHFSNGETVVNGTKYWFLCEPIAWKIMENSASTYLMYSMQALHGGINWGYSNSDTYETSQVRAWLNGTSTHSGQGFFQTALFNCNTYVQPMTIDLDDGSSRLNDNVRLLTKGEASDSKYFANDAARKLVPTDWAAAHHVCFQNGSSSFTRWWLCEANLIDDDEGNHTCAWGVGLGGAVGHGGPKTAKGSNDRAERPVIKITIA